MSSCCDNFKNPLMRDGISQLQRQPRALSPMSVQIDERQLADMLTFIYRFAKQINYYDNNNSIVTNKSWQVFFNDDAIIQIALISKTNPLPIKENFSNSLKILAEEETKDYYTNVFDMLFSLAQEIFGWYVKLQYSSAIRRQINQLIKTGLVTAVKQALTLAEQVRKESGTGFLVKEEWQTFPQIEDIAFFLQTLKNMNTPLGTPEEVVQNIDSIFQMIYKVYVQIIALAPAYLTDQVNGDQQTKSHLALLITFLRLMEHTTQDINLLPGKHLEFYYKKVLQLKEKTAVPDKAHLVFELAKHLDEHKLEAGTLLKAGKDNTGVERLYQLEQELVINKAQITSFKTLYLNFTTVQHADEKIKYFKTIHVAPAANSGDGKGGEFPDKTLPGWPAFGSIDMAKGVAGFAVASKLLLLQEGTRTITFEIAYTGNSAIFPPGTDYLHQAFDIHLSGEKDWIKFEKLSATTTIDKILISAVLDVTQPPVTGFNAKLGNLQTTLPVAKVLVNFDSTTLLNDNITVSPYHFLKEIFITDIALTVKAEGIKNLILQNDLSVIDANKPFQPFGAAPQAGAEFYIGSAEIFQKQLINLTLKWNWQKLPADLDKHYEGYYLKDKLPNLKEVSADIQSLNDKTWKDVKKGQKLLVNDGEDAIEAGITTQVPTENLTGTGDLDTLTVYDNSTANGFVRLVLNEVMSNDGNAAYKTVFLYEDYVKVLSRQAMAVAKYPVGLPGALYKNAAGDTITQYKSTDTSISGEVVLPNEPYLPVIKDLTVDYTAVAGIEKISFFHLHPFEGFEQIHLMKRIAATPAKPVALLPQFDDEGSLLIGISGLKPPENLSILFQVVESSANTDLIKANVVWHYLFNNQWIPFEDYQIISDTTEGLIASGVISFEIPREITSDNTVLPAGMCWLRATAAERTGAVCNLLNAFTQAGSVVFSDNGNDPNHYITPLPANSIAKLVVNDSGVRSISQPYDSFGARPREQHNDFYVRASERLRHKGRAITIFDYERIVLEKFNEIYKVRCINHTDDIKELSPGNVTMAVVPELKNKSLVDRLSPRVNINLLKKIEDHLGSVSSPHVTVKVLNPKYEQVKVAFQVKFFPGKSTGYYKRQLNESIMRFLSPWAFFEEAAEINFGGKIYKSSILDFVEKQEYVDYVLDFKMMHLTKESVSETDVDEITASFARTILTSVEAHAIEAITSDKVCLPNKPINKTGYGYMTLMQDFEILVKDGD